MSCLCYLYLLAYSGAQHILCRDIVLLFFALCDLCCHFLWIVLFLLPFRYSLMFNHDVGYISAGEFLSISCRQS
jgi:hypothetical protein